MSRHSRLSDKLITSLHGTQVPIVTPLQRKCIQCGALRYERCRWLQMKPDDPIRYRRTFHMGR